MKLKPERLAYLGPPGISKVIFEAGMHALLVALTLWKKRIGNSIVVDYTDNNSTRGVCISGSALNPSGKELVPANFHLEGRLSLVAWYVRVPSPSSTADGSSRGALGDIPAKFLLNVLVEVTVNHCLSMLPINGTGDHPCSGQMGVQR